MRSNLYNYPLPLFGAFTQITKNANTLPLSTKYRTYQYRSARGSFHDTSLHHSPTLSKILLPSYVGTEPYFLLLGTFSPRILGGFLSALFHLLLKPLLTGRILLLWRRVEDHAGVHAAAFISAGPCRRDGAIASAFCEFWCRECRLSIHPLMTQWQFQITKGRDEIRLISAPHIPLTLA